MSTDKPAIKEITAEEMYRQLEEAGTPLLTRDNFPKFKVIDRRVFILDWDPFNEELYSVVEYILELPIDKDITLLRQKYRIVWVREGLEKTTIGKKRNPLFYSDFPVKELPDDGLVFSIYEYVKRAEAAARNNVEKSFCKYWECSNYNANTKTG